MKVQIWSDIACPFCYIGKRRFERALKQYSKANEVEIEWKSFQLDPMLPFSKGKPIVEYLSESKMKPATDIQQMLNYVSMLAKSEGLNFAFDKIYASNTLFMHQIIQFAKTKGLGDVAEERFMKAYFIDGSEYWDKEVLIKLAVEIGLDQNETKDILETGKFIESVKNDIIDARSKNIYTVPYFIFNDKYSISGAQPSAAFLEILNKADKE